MRVSNKYAEKESSPSEPQNTRLRVNAQALPGSVDIKKLQSKVTKDFQAVIVDLYSDLLTSERKKDKQYKETQELLKIIRSLQKSNEKEKEDLIASHERHVHKLMKQHTLHTSKYGEKVRKEMIVEMDKEIEITKRKQWCAHCHKEGNLYCCWNTTYCDTNCQTLNWPSHINRCENNKKKMENK